MLNYARNFDVKNYWNQTTILQLIANNISGCFFLKHPVYCTCTSSCCLKAVLPFMRLSEVRTNKSRHDLLFMICMLSKLHQTYVVLWAYDRVMLRLQMICRQKFDCSSKTQISSNMLDFAILPTQYKDFYCNIFAWFPSEFIANSVESLWVTSVSEINETWQE